MAHGSWCRKPEAGQAASRQGRLTRWPAKPETRTMIPEAGFMAPLSNKIPNRKGKAAEKL
jgi:hypothetical protein